MDGTVAVDEVDGWTAFTLTLPAVADDAFPRENVPLVSAPLQ